MHLMIWGLGAGVKRERKREKKGEEEEGGREKRGEI